MNITALLRRMVLIVVGICLMSAIAASPALAKGGGPVMSEVENNIASVKSGYDCPYCALSEADLSRLNLKGIDLTDSVLYRANLSGTNLSGATLYNTFLQDADLSGADLSNADLTGADLSFANLKGAKVTGDQLGMASSRQRTIYPDGSVHP